MSAVRNAAGLILPVVGTEAINERLAEIPGAVAPGAQAVPVPDEAGWHGAKALTVPDTITLLPLPPRAPQLIPAESVCTQARANRPAITVFDTCDAIVTACRTAWNRVATDPGTVTSITSRAMEQARGKGRRHRGRSRTRGLVA